jgi:hypothetical protein
VTARIVSDALWALLALVGAALAIASRLPGQPVARASWLVRRLQGAPVGDVAVLLGWMWLGWHFFAR